MVEAVRGAFEPLQATSRATIDLYKEGYCDEDPSVGYWLESHHKIEDYDFNPALIAFLNRETALRIVPAILLGALDDPRFPTDHEWLYWNVRILASLFESPESERFVKDFFEWFSKTQLDVFADVLLHLSTEPEWHSRSGLLATGATLLRIGSMNQTGSQA